MRDIFGDFTRFGDDLLSHTLRCSTIGAVVLNCRVRNGAGCFTYAMITKPSKIPLVFQVSYAATVIVVCFDHVDFGVYAFVPVFLLLDQIKPIEQLVPVN